MAALSASRLVCSAISADRGGDFADAERAGLQAGDDAHGAELALRRRLDGVDGALYLRGDFAHRQFARAAAPTRILGAAARLGEGGREAGRGRRAIHARRRPPPPPRRRSAPGSAQFLRGGGRLPKPGRKLQRRGADARRGVLGLGRGGALGRAWGRRFHGGGDTRAPPRQTRFLDKCQTYFPSARPIRPRPLTNARAADKRSGSLENRWRGITCQLEAAFVSGSACTGEPGPIFCRLPTITRSPSLRPFTTLTSGPSVGPKLQRP